MIKPINNIFKENYPIGALSDKNAPWANKDKYISKIETNFDIQNFEITFNDGTVKYLDFIDFLEYYWSKNPGSFKEMDDFFRNNYDGDQNFADSFLIKYLKNEKKVKFFPYINDIVKEKGLMENKIRQAIKKMIFESFSENEKKPQEEKYNVYHIRVSEGGKLNFIAIETELPKSKAEDMVEKLSKNYPSETFISDKEGPIQSKYQTNENKL